MSDVLRGAARAAGASFREGIGGVAAMAVAVAVAAALAEVIGVRLGWLRRAIALVPVAVVVAVGVVAVAYAADLTPEATALDAVLDVAGVTAALLAIVVSIAVGTLLLVAPGLAAIVLFAYVVPIVLTERTSPVTALFESGTLAIRNPDRAIPVAGAAVAGLVASATAGVGTTRTLRAIGPDLGAVAGGGAVAGLGAAAVVLFLVHAHRLAAADAEAERPLDVREDPA